MVVPLFGWSAGDIVTPIKILSTIAGAFKEATGAKSQFAEASTWLESFASDLERMNEYTTENPDAKYTKNIIEQVASIHSHYAEFEMYLQKFDNGLSSTRDASVITVVVKKIKWTFKELKGKVDSLKFAVTGPILSINMLLMLQCR
jgi:anaerobic ribonucleoside-triphosphate reductase